MKIRSKNGQQVLSLVGGDKGTTKGVAHDVQFLFILCYFNICIEFLYILSQRRDEKIEKLDSGELRDKVVHMRKERRRLVIVEDVKIESVFSEESESRLVGRW